MHSDTAAPKSILSARFFSVFFVNMLLNLSIYTGYSQLPLFAKALGAPADQIGVLSSTFAVTALLFRFVSGPAINAFSLGVSPSGRRGIKRDKTG